MDAVDVEPMTLPLMFTMRVAAVSASRRSVATCDAEWFRLNVYVFVGMLSIGWHCFCTMFMREPTEFSMIQCVDSNIRTMLSLLLMRSCFFDPS